MVVVVILEVRRRACKWVEVPKLMNDVHAEADHGNFQNK
jgi:hypothetical protein